MMCSLMEKDVLIEEVSATAAFIFYRTGKECSTKKEFYRCAEINSFLYSNDPEDIDATKIRSELKEIKKKFEGLPRIY